MPILGVSLAVRSIPKNKHSEKVNTGDKHPHLFVSHCELSEVLTTQCAAPGTQGSGHGP